MKLPKIAALITASGGIGSHYVLHKLQGHPKIASLYEGAFRSNGGTTKSDLKKYLSQGIYPGQALQTEQLHPVKDLRNPSNVDWIVMNKPPIGTVLYHQNYHRDIPIIYIFRNPISFFHTWLRTWKEYGDSRYASRHLDDEAIFKWFKGTFLSSLFHLAQFYNPERDHIISFEHFFSDIDSALAKIFKTLDVPVLKNEELKELERCPICIEKLSTKVIDIPGGSGHRKEEVLSCEEHGPLLGPGHYNFIRKEDSSFLNKWKQKEDTEKLCSRFSEIYGKDFIDYYYQEKYLEDTDAVIFDDLINKFLRRLKI